MARTRTRRDGTGGAATAPLVRDFARPAVSVPITFDVRTVYDFALSLDGDAGSTEDLPADDRRWLETSRAWLREEAGPEHDQFHEELPTGMLGLVVDRPEITDAAAFLEAVEAADVMTLKRAAFAEELRPGPNREIGLRAMDGDPVAIEDVVRRLSEYHAPDKRDRVEAYLREPERLTEPARRTLRIWYEKFREIEPRIAGILRRDADARAEDRERLDAADLIEKTTNGIRWTSEPGVARVILAPSYFSRPYNSLFAGEDWRLICYPVADDALDLGDPLAPPQAVVRLHRALGDDTRLRILRLLRDGDRYLTEIAQALELSKPTVKHHLALLRSAGLVTVMDQGTYTYYSLRRDRLEQAGTELRSFLLS